MKSEFIVTIGLTVKNNESTVKTTLNSILAQTFLIDNIELIIVDGYSADKTINIIENILKKSVITHRYFFENVGLSYARQITVNESIGKYIIWVDGDVVLSPTYIKKLVEYMEKHPTVGIAKGQYGIYNINNLVGLLEDIEFVLDLNTIGQIDSKVLATSGSMYRVNAIRDINGFDLNITGAGEDTDAEYRIREKGWSTHIVSVLLYEQRRTSWKELWDEYYWHGHGGYYNFKKHRRLYSSRQMFFPLLLVDSIIRIQKAYILIHKKEVFLLPVHYIYKRIAWLFGFIHAKIM